MSNQGQEMKMELSIFEIKLIGFSITPSGKKLNNPLSSEEYEFSFEFNNELLLQDKLVVTNSKVVISKIANGNEAKEELASIETRVSIRVNNLEELIIQGEADLKIAEELLMTANSVAAATTRGMCVMCTASTTISNAYLPILDVRTLIPKQG